jgi:cupin 2 domain-containing protein
MTSYTAQNPKIALMPSKQPQQIRRGNLFSDVPQALTGELVTQIASGPSLRIERIVSTGQKMPEGEWLHQDQDEWVLVLKGRATLSFEDDNTGLEMAAGDYALIPAHCRHRVAWTSEDEPTVWLAVHYDAADTSL